ncbi:hypothetical protein GCM10025876_35750 [Demequina litorisediminis]|uniref:Amino acid permease n=1 Tax=Demequina litorisediminis TaxID=1849022 RepID=A0ABQ6IIZ6_9MICO|nr:amino acid permease [Demequina litorisediminis]GMA37371.1 hypothetical protein GCM10025876_35750 [Demequina litorisediminis]
MVAFAGFSWETFVDNLWGSPTHTAGDLAEQVRATMLVTVFVFLGVEGANVFSRYARRREDVGRATVTGFLTVLALFVVITMLSYGVLPREELASLRQPSAAGVIEAAVGSWGAWMVGIGLLISVLGAYLAWTLLGAEVLFAAASGDDAPRALATLSPRGVPLRALTATSLLSQVFLVIAHFSRSASDFSLEAHECRDDPAVFAHGGVRAEAHARRHPALGGARSHSLRLRVHLLPRLRDGPAVRPDRTRRVRTRDTDVLAGPP